MNRTLAKTKRCGYCKQVFAKPRRLNGPQWEKQECCNMDCAMALRRQRNGDWREQSKVCKACDAVFRPSEGMRKRSWESITTCSAYCSTAVGHGQRVVPMVPEELETPGQRVKFLRLCVRKDGAKKPWTQQLLAAEAGLGVTTIGKIEEGRPMTVEWQEKVAAALKVPTWLLTVPVKRWVGVVKGSGLSARHAVPVEGGGE
jgi:DNA-binding XRE family transcriptional regulator